MTLLPLTVYVGATLDRGYGTDKYARFRKRMASCAAR